MADKIGLGWGTVCVSSGALKASGPEPVVRHPPFTGPCMLCRRRPPAEPLHHFKPLLSYDDDRPARSLPGASGRLPEHPWPAGLGRWAAHLRSAGAALQPDAPGHRQGQLGPAGGQCGHSNATHVTKGSWSPSELGQWDGWKDGWADQRTDGHAIRLHTANSPPPPTRTDVHAASLLLTSSSMPVTNADPRSSASRKPLLPDARAADRPLAAASITSLRSRRRPSRRTHVLNAVAPTVQQSFSLQPAPFPSTGGPGAAAACRWWLSVFVRRGPHLSGSVTVLATKGAAAAAGSTRPCRASRGSLMACTRAGPAAARGPCTAIMVRSLPARAHGRA